MTDPHSVSEYAAAPETAAEPALPDEDARHVPNPGRWRRRAGFAVVGLLLAAATVAAYWQAFGSEFVNYDDNMYVYDNPHVQAGLTRDDLRWAIFTTETVNWYPLTWISLQLDSQIWGVGKPFGFHLTNVVLHVADTLLLFYVLVRMSSRLGRSAVVAGLFALHPLHVESVAWVTERKDVLSAFFWMLALAAYVSYARRPHWARYLLVVLAFTLGLTAKSMLVTLPGVLFLLDFWPLRRYPSQTAADADGGQARGFRAARVSWLRLLAEKVPLIVLSAASTAITVYAQQKGGETNPLQDMPVRIDNALISYMTYIGKTLWPANLVPYYPFPKEYRGGYISTFEASEAGLVLLGLTILALALARRRPYLAVGWFWFLGTLAPVIGVVQVLGDYSMADRFTYIPLIGLFITAVWGAADFLERAGVRPWAPACAAVVLLAGLGVRTWEQVGYWHDSFTLWQHTLAVNPRNHLAYNNIGNALFVKGDYPRADWYFRRAIENDPAYYLSHYSLGCTLAQEGQMDAALAEYAAATQIYAGDRDLQALFGWTLLTRGRPADAVLHLEAAVKIDPTDANAQMNLGYAQYLVGKSADAVPHYQAALAHGADTAPLHDDLGLALADQGDLDGAVAEYEAALRLDPSYAAAHSHLAKALMRQGKLMESARHTAEAERLSQPRP